MAQSRKHTVCATLSGEYPKAQPCFTPWPQRSWSVAASLSEGGPLSLCSSQLEREQKIQGPNGMFPMVPLMVGMQHLGPRAVWLSICPLSCGWITRNPAAAFILTSCSIPNPQSYQSFREGGGGASGDATMGDWDGSECPYSWFCLNGGNAIAFCALGESRNPLVVAPFVKLR